MVSSLSTLFRRRKNRQRAVKKDPALADTRFVVLDTELTGLTHRDSVISIGAIQMSGSAIELGSYFYRMMNPECVIHPDSILVHEITQSEIELEPHPKPILAEFLDYCRDTVIVGYCIDIDLFYLNKELTMFHQTKLTNPAIDIYVLYEWMTCKQMLKSRHSSEQANKNLYTIAADLNVSVSASHHALADAYITAQIFQRFLALLRREGVTNIGMLLNIGGPASTATRARRAAQAAHF